MSDLLLGTIAIVVVPAVVLLVLALVARGCSHRLPGSPGARFAPLAEGAVLRDALLLSQDRRAFAAVLLDLAVRRRIRLLRPAAEDGKRAPIAVETVEGAVFTASEIAVLEALFGREHASERVRRFSADSRELTRRVRTVLSGEEQKGIADGLFAARPRTWPTVLLRIFAVAGIPPAVILGLAALDADAGADWASFSAAAAGLVLVLVTLFVAPRPWRRFTAAAEPARAHLAGMREYIGLAEREPLRALQSVDGAISRGDVSGQAREEGLERFLLNERMLPYAVLFGMERSWLKLLGEHAGELRATTGVGDVVDGAFEVLAVIEIVGGAVELVRAVGDLADAAGATADFVGGVFDAFS